MQAIVKRQALAMPVVYTVSAVGLAALAWAAPRVPFGYLPEVALFFGLCALAQLMPVPLFRSSSYSVAFAVTFASVVYLGTAAAVWVNLGSALVICFWPKRKAPVKMLFNVGQLALAAFAAGSVYEMLGGSVRPERLEWTLLPPAIVSITLYFFANTGLLALAISLTSNSSFQAVWGLNYRWMAPNVVGLGLLGVGMAVAVQAIGLLGLTIFCVPIAMAWYSFKLYMAKTEEVRRRNEELQLTNARLDMANARLNQRVTELDALNRIGLSLNSSLDLSNVLGEILDATLRLVPVQAAAVALRDPQSGRLAIASSANLATRAAQSVVAYSGPVTRAAEASATLSIPDTAAAGETALADAGIGSLHCLPLRAAGSISGVFFVAFAAPRAVSGDEERLLSTLAEQASTAVHNARLYQEIEASYLSTVQAMVSVVDQRERYAQGHAERVRTYAAACAKEMGLDQRRTQTLELAALFHDIGHIGVPESVLNKPGELTREEWELVRKHPLLGVTILKQVPRMETVVPVILQHHERYDGLGYPEGLLGNDTDLLAQILAVADAYEAMTSPRPHRPALSPTQAAAELKKNSGTQFAPQVVEAFVKAVAEPVRVTAGHGATEPALLKLFRA